MNIQTPYLLRTNIHIWWIYLVLLNLSCAPALYDVWESHPPSFDTSKIKRIAVLPFKNYSSYNGAGVLLSDKLTSKLAQSGQFVIIEREALEAILDEQDLGLYDLVEDATAARAGRLLGANAIITGKVTLASVNSLSSKEYSATYDAVQVSTTASVNASIRVLDTETGRLLWSKSSSKAINDQGFVSTRNSGKEAEELVDAFADLAFVIKTKKKQPKAPQVVLQETLALVTEDLFWDLVPHRTRIRKQKDQLKPYLGIGYADLNEKIYKITRCGIRVTNVVRSSAAEEYGIQKGDILLSIDGQKIENSEAFQPILNEKKPFKTIKVELLRLSIKVV